MPWRAQCGRLNFLWVTGGVCRIGCSPHYFLIYLCMYLFIYLFIYLYPTYKTDLSSWSNKNYILKRNNSYFAPEVVTFCFRWLHYTPPHSHRSLAGLPTSVSKFLVLFHFVLGWKVYLCWAVVLCLPLTGFPTQRSLYPTLFTYH
jgi:hypothetical protein